MVIAKTSQFDEHRAKPDIPRGRHYGQRCSKKKGSQKTLVKCIYYQLLAKPPSHKLFLAGTPAPATLCGGVSTADCQSAKVAITLAAVSIISARLSIAHGYFIANASFKSFASRTPALANC